MAGWTVVPNGDTSAWKPVNTPSAPYAPDLPAGVGEDAFKSGVYSKMLDVPPGFIYQNLDEVDGQMKKAGVSNSIARDIEVGSENSIFGLMNRAYKGKGLPETLQNPSLLDKFASGLSTMIEDLPVYIGGGLVGGAAGSEVPVVGNVAGGAMGAFAVPDAIRAGLMDSIEKGDVKGFGDLMHRIGDVGWAAGKGAITGLVTHGAGKVALPFMKAAPELLQNGVKSLQQVAAMTTAGDLLDGRMPHADEFVTNAAMIVPLGMATHGTKILYSDARKALMDRYAESGNTPDKSALKLQAQPHDAEDMKPGLRAAIKIGNDHLTANEGEDHADFAERSLGQRPVSMAALEAQPDLADRVLKNPEIQDQEVLDRAWTLNAEAVEAGAGQPLSGEAENRPTGAEGQDKVPRSGRGFVTPDDKFLTREQAESWVDENEPDVHKSWDRTAPESKEFHAGDYFNARKRVETRNAIDGEPNLNAVTPAYLTWLKGLREEIALNKVKAEKLGDAYGAKLIRGFLDSADRQLERGLFTGARNVMRADTGQVAASLGKLVSDPVEQVSLSFMRDYKGDPELLNAEIAKAEKDENLAKYVPAMKQALTPTPQMLEADKVLTGYFTKYLELGRQFGVLDSNIDPSKYSPRLFSKTLAPEDERATFFPQAKFTERDANAIQRTQLHQLDALKSGNFEAKTFNAVDELSIYGDRISTAIATKIFKTELKNSEMGKYGTRSDVPKNWVELPGSGNEHGSGFYVPPKIAKTMRPILDPNVFSGEGPFKNLRLVQKFTKAAELSFSFFHMKAETFMSVNNMSWSSADFVRQWAHSNSSPEFKAQELEGTLYGLMTTMTGKPYEAYQKNDDLPISRGMVRSAAAWTGKEIQNAAAKISYLTFDVIQRKYKVNDFSMKQAAWITDHPEATDGEYGKAMRGIAKEVNAVYGGLNWEVMGVSNNWQEIIRAFVLAPDWTFSNVAGLKYALTDSGTAGQTSREFLIKSFITGAALTQATSLMVSGQQSKHWNEVYLGTDKNGKELYSNMYFAGLPKDAATWITRMQKDGGLRGTEEFASYKLGPLVGTGYRVLTNKDWTGQPIDKPKDTALVKTGKQLKFAAQETLPVPFGISTIAKQYSLKDAIHGNLVSDEDITYKDFLGSLAGAQIKHEGAKPRRSGGGSFRIPGVGRSSGPPGWKE